MTPVTPQLSASSRASLYAIARANPQYQIISELFVQTKTNDNKSPNLEKSRSLLVAIRLMEVRAAHRSDVERYNDAIQSFNRFYPERPLNAVPPSHLTRLFNECLRPITTHNPTIAESARSNFQAYAFAINLKGEREIVEELVDDFIDKGGQVEFLPCIPNTERLEGAVPVTTEEIIPVCYAGWFRSAASYQFATQMQQRLGFCFGTKTRPTHGILKGYDPSTWVKNDPFAWTGDEGERPGSPFFLQAFGMQRPIRSGYEFYTEYRSGKIDSEELIKRFQASYYSHESDKPKIFFTFMDTGFFIMKILLEINPTSEQNPQPLKGIKIVLIPDQDWISRYTISDQMRKAVTETRVNVQPKPKASIKPFSDLTDQERRKVYWAFRGWHEITEEIKTLLESYVDYIDKLRIFNTPDPLTALMLVEGYRAAYWKWSGAFLPVRA